MKFFKMLKERAQDLVAKIVSIKFLIFVIASGFLWAGKLPWYGWLIAAAAVMGIRYFEKIANLGEKVL